MSRLSPDIHVFADAEQTSIACGEHILGLLRDRLSSAPYVTLAISGGSSPRRMFQFMDRSDLENFDASWSHEPKCRTATGPRSQRPELEGRREGSEGVLQAIHCEPGRLAVPRFMERKTGLA